MYRKIITVLLASACLPGANIIMGANLLKNPGFNDLIKTRGQLMPTAWHVSSWGTDKTKAAEFNYDAKVFHSAKYSAKIKQSVGTNYCQFIQKVKIVPAPVTRKIYVAAWIQAENAEAGSIVITADTAAKRTALWRQVASFGGSFGWKQIVGSASIPSGAIAVNLSIRLKGTGLIRIDDCVMSFEAIPIDSSEMKSAGTKVNLLVNPDFVGKINDLTHLPAGWEKTAVHGYETVFEVKVTPGKLKQLTVDWKSGGAKCGASPLIAKKLLPGNYIFQAKARTTGDSVAGLGVNEDVSAPVSGSAWKTTSILFTAGPDAENDLFCWNIGQGKVEFSDVKLYAVSRQKDQIFPLKALVMPVENTVIWSGKRQVNSFEDAPVPVAFDLKKLKEFKTGKLVIEIPVELRLTEAYNFYPSYYKPEIPSVNKIMKQGTAYRRYTFTNPQIFSILKKKYIWGRKLVVAIEPEKPLARKSFTIFWHLEADNRSSAEQSFVFNLLPPLKKVDMPRNFPILCWGMKDINFLNPGILDRIAENYEKAGIKTRPRILMDSERSRQVDKKLEAKGWKMFVANPDYAEMKFNQLKKSPLFKEIKLVYYNTGKVNAKHLCPTWINTSRKFKMYLKAFLKEKYRKCGAVDGDIILYDIEPWQPMTWCFCDDCRRAFARKNGIKGVPGASEILDKYSDKWSEFRCRQTADITKLHTEIFKELYPGSSVFDYDYVINFSRPDFKDIFRKVAKDSRLNEQYFDGHISSYYHYLDQQAFDLIACNVDNLKKAYYVICAIDRLGYLSPKKVLSPGRLRMLLLATAVNGGSGFVIFPGEHIDGSYLKMFNKTMHEIAQVEDIMKNGKEIKIVPSRHAAGNITEKAQTKLEFNKYFRYNARRQGNRILLSLFNYDPKQTSRVMIDLQKHADAKYIVTDVSSGDRINSPSGKYWSARDLKKLIVDMKPMEAKLLLVSE